MENRQPLQAGSCSRAEGDRAIPPSVKAKPYDLLSFVSLFIHNTTEYSVALTLSNLNVDRLMTKAEQPKAGGSISAVTIIEVKDIEETLRRTSLSRELDGKEVIAFKRLVMKGSLNSARNKDLLNYVAVEYQVLRHKGLYNHPNILKLYGVSWMSAGIKDSLMLPVLILEAADHGDLASLLQKKEELTQIEKLFISMDIADGLWAMHECGIIHGDVKPDNILVFRHPGRKYLAKLSDFGSSVFLHDSPALNRLKTGTPLWQAPECLQLIESSQLARTDIYSLGMVIHDIFLNGLYSSIIKAMPSSEVQLMKDDDLIKLHAAQTQLLLAKGRAGSGIEEYDKEVHENLGLLLYTMLSKDPKDRTSSTREVLQRLRYIAKESVNNAIVAPILFPSGDQAKDLQAMTDINSWRFADDVLFYPGKGSRHVVDLAFADVFPKNCLHLR
jgi:serine/threonine protein kinase